MADLASGIVATAQSLGMNPVDLATIISYETGGTFDPTQAGPTTQWGQHRGLIQFGEPQAQQYGVDWNDALGSQLGPDGAVARYFKANGWRPGMSLMDAYSIVNAGGPGRYGASDAGNGGAPGTVADKVAGFAPHRQRAMALLGASGGPAGGPVPPQDARSSLAGVSPPENALASVAPAPAQGGANALAWNMRPLDAQSFMTQPNALALTYFR